MPDMPVPESWKAFTARRRWRRPGFSAQQLRLLGLLLLTLAAAVQGFYFIQQVRGEASDVVKTIGQSTAWRSANYGYSKNLADFVLFLQRNIPGEAKVLWPPQESGSRLPGATFMQVLLYPRTLLQCPTSGCGDISTDEGTFFVVAGDFPEGEILQRATELREFNERWGVITFDPAGFTEHDPAPQFQSIFEALRSTLLPVLWMLLLTASGTLIAAQLLQQGNFYMQAALGFGLGAGLFTILVGLASLMGIPLTAPVMAWSAAILAGSAALTVLVRRTHSENGGIRPFTRALKKPQLDGWVLVFLGLAAISALAAAGKGYRVSDELLIWAPKGYGIAYSGTLAGVTEWGTNTLPYPLQVPILIAASNLLFGDILPAAKLVFSAYYLAVLILAYSYLIQIGVRPYSAGCCTLLVATTPLIFRHATIAYANLPFSFNLMAAVLVLARAVPCGSPRQPGAKRAYLLSGLFFMLAAWTRPEGTWMAWLLIASLALLAVFRRRGATWRDWGWLVAPMFFYQIYWWLVSRSAYLEGVERSQIGLQAFSAMVEGNLHLTEGLYILTAGFSRLLNFESWGVWGMGLILLAAAGTWGWKKKRGGSSLVFLAGWLMLGMVVVMYYIASFDKNHDISWWVSTGLERMLFPGLLLLWLGGIQLVHEGRKEATEPDKLI